MDSQSEEKEVRAEEIRPVLTAPHIRTPETIRSLMLDVIIALLPSFVWGVYHFGTRSLLVGGVSVAACLLFEMLTQLLLHRPVTVGDLSAVVTGLLLAMQLSVAVPLWIPVVGAFFAIVIVKQLFGGLGKNIVNPAAAAYVFLLSFSSAMQKFPAVGEKLNGWNRTYTTDAELPLAALKDGRFPDVSLADMILGNTVGGIGEVAALLLIAGGVYLLVRRVISWQIPVACLGTVAVLTFLFPQTETNPMYFMLCELFSGSLLLGAVFMATDGVTSPVTPNGRLLYGVGCGVLTVLLRYFGVYTEGVAFAILMMNLLVGYIDRWTAPVRWGGNHGERKKNGQN